jgi:hypothetical protein
MAPIRPRHFVAFAVANSVGKTLHARVYECANASERDTVVANRQNAFRALNRGRDLSSCMACYDSVASLESGMIADFGPEIAAVAERIRPVGLFG